jgi:catechol 2,3-dioxygenase-like lactoylglutathione lyase family enzyme
LRSFAREQKSPVDWYSLLTMKFQIARLDHLQLAAPEGCESAAREFYGVLLGLREIPKPAALQSRGGCWFACGPQQLHIGVEKDFRPARKAHPAFAVTNLDDLRRALLSRNIQVTDDASVPGVRRFHTQDPWGNRLEFVESLLSYAPN